MNLTADAVNLTADAVILDSPPMIEANSLGPPQLTVMDAVDLDSLSLTDLDLVDLVPLVPLVPLSSTNMEVTLTLTLTLISTLALLRVQQTPITVMKNLNCKLILN